MDWLIRLRKVLKPLTTRLGLTEPATRCYRKVLRWYYGPDGLAWGWQNDRLWCYRPDILLRGDFQEFDTILWLRQVVRPGDCVLDVGANVGQMTLEAALLAGPTGRVFAIEPGPGNVRLLQRHLEANGLADRVEVIPAACAAVHGQEIVLNVWGDQPDVVGSGHTTRPVHEPGYNTGIRVPTVSVDGRCRDRGLKPAVIKIDVEGAEIEVLRGAQQTLRECRPLVRIGFHPFA